MRRIPTLSVFCLSLDARLAECRQRAGIERLSPPSVEAPDVASRTPRAPCDGAAQLIDLIERYDLTLEDDR
jgi:hypothetical protein